MFSVPNWYGDINSWSDDGGDWTDGGGHYFYSYGYSYVKLDLGSPKAISTIILLYENVHFIVYGTRDTSDAYGAEYKWGNKKFEFTVQSGRNW